MLHKNNELLTVTVTPPYPVHDFIRTTSDGVRYHSENAFADLSIISPVFKGKMLFAINEDKSITITAESTGNEPMTRTILEDFAECDLFELTCVPYGGTTVLNCKYFKSEDGLPLYMNMSKPRPIDKLRELMRNTTPEKAAPENESGEVDHLSVKQQPHVEGEVVENNPLEKLFGNMSEHVSSDNYNKILKDITEHKNKLSENERKLEQILAEDNRLRDTIKNMSRRLENLSVKREHNGMTFHLTFIRNEDNVTETEMKTVERVSSVLGLNPEYVKNLYSKKTFLITFYNVESIDNDTVKQITDCDFTGTFSMKKSNTIQYTGEKTYNELIQALENNGFKHVELEPTSSHHKIELVEMTTDDEEEKNYSYFDHTDFPEIPKDLQPVIYGSYENESIVLMDAYGTLHDKHSKQRGGRDVELDDDFINFYVFNNGKIYSSHDTAGFLSIMSVEEYQEVLANLSEEEKETMGDIGISGVYLHNFTGDIGFLVCDDDGNFTNDFNLNDYIQHQIGGSICIILPDNTNVTVLNDDLTIPQ